MPKNRAQFDPELVIRQFKEEQEALIAEIDGIVGSIDCEHAFVSLATSQMVKMNGKDGFREIEHGMIPALVELAAFYLYPNFGVSDVRDAGIYQKLFDTLEKLNTVRGLNTAFEIDHTDRDLARLQVRALLYAESVRGSAYPPQIQQRIEKIQGIHEDWFKAKVGIGPKRSIEILESFEKLANGNFQQQKSKFETITEEMFALVGKMTGEADPVVENERKSLGTEMKKFFDESSEVLAVSFKQLCSMLDDFSTDEWESLAKLIGTTKQSRKLMGHPREIRSRPVYFLGEERFLIVDYASALDAVFESFDEVSRGDQSFRDKKYVPKMSKWMEDESTSYLQRVFPNGEVFSSLRYADPEHPGGEAELDGAVLWGPFLILSEVKGKQYRSRSRLGDPSRLRDDLKASIEEAFDQASRAIRYIESTDEAVFKEGDTGRILKVKKSNIRRIYPLSVTLYHFGGLATQLAMLKRLGLFKGASYPWSLAIGDLDTITRFAKSPEVFLHYAQRRIEIQESQEDIIGDEIDLFGTYLDTRLHPSGSWGMKRKEHEGSRMFHFTGGSERFDDWFQVEQGTRKECAPIALDLPPVFLEVLEELRKRDDDGARWIAFALLGLSQDGTNRVTDALQKLRKQAVGDGRIGRITFKEDDLVVSLLGGVGLSASRLRQEAACRCGVEKYRLKATRSLAIGFRVEDTEKPFDCACWLEGVWEEDSEMVDFLDAEKPKLLLDRKFPGRNELCPCGSQKKFKKCCIARFQKN